MRVKGTIGFRGYPLVSRAVEEGIVCGWARAHKHTDKPAEVELKEAIHHYIMLELCEILEFGDDNANDA